MTIVDMNEALEQKLLQELLVITEEELYRLSGDYQELKKVVDHSLYEVGEMKKELQRMNDHAEKLSKRHSSLERILGIHNEH